MTVMTITLRNPTRQPANYSLTMDCVCTDLVPTVGIRMKTVYAESYPHRPAMIAETVKHPPSISLSAREIRKGLPDAVVFAPEIVAAVAAGHLIVIPEVNPVYQRPASPEAATEATVEGVPAPVTQKLAKPAGTKSK